MRISIPREIKNNEYRVAITPAGVHDLVANGHEVHVESGAGDGSSIPDSAYSDAGAIMEPDAASSARGMRCVSGSCHSPSSRSGSAPEALK